MSFIRVSRVNTDSTKVDINTAHIVSYEVGQASTIIVMSTDEELHVNETPRQLRSFIKKAQGTLPQASATE